MRRILFIAVLAAIGFWVAWPAYSGYRISAALRGSDAASLGSSVDFDGVRASLRPFVGAEVEKRLGGVLEKAGVGAAVLGGEVKKQLLPKIVDGLLVTMVTPQNVIRIFRDGRAFKEAISRIVDEEMADSGGKGSGVAMVLKGLGELAKGRGADADAGAGRGGGLGGLLGGLKKSPVRDVTGEPEPGAVPKPAEAKPAAPPPFGLKNIKSFGFAGPLRMLIGVARNAAATEPDVTAEMSFTGMDWKLTGLVPRF